jgi:hypothetical protein
VSSEPRLARFGHYRAYPHFRLKDGAQYVSAADPEELVWVQLDLERLGE